MSNFRLALALSVSAHFFVFLSPALLPGSIRQKIGSPRDFHLPVAVELVASEDAKLSRTLPQPQDLRVKSTTSSVVHPLHPMVKNHEPVFLSDSMPVQTNQKNSESHLAQAAAQSQVRAPLPSAKSWNRPPVYPDIARRLGQEGRVILDAQLNEDGQVLSVKVARSSGFALLDQAAVDAVSSWKMDVPATGGRRLFIPVTFELKANS